MRHAVRLSVQEQYLRGDTMIEKWEHAQRLGFDAIELRGRPATAASRRGCRNSRTAAAAGVPMPTVCVEMLHFVGDFDADKRADAYPDEVPAQRDGRDRWPAGDDARLVRDVQHPAAPVRVARVPRPKTRDPARCLRSAGRARRSARG